MTNHERALRGEQAFAAVNHDANDPLTQVYDLICDLLHFADEHDGADWGLTDESCGAFCLRMAEFHYTAELVEEKS